jgi:hypothetical protein
MIDIKFGYGFDSNVFRFFIENKKAQKNIHKFILIFHNVLNKIIKY